MRYVTLSDPHVIKILATEDGNNVVGSIETLRTATMYDGRYAHDIQHFSVTKRLRKQGVGRELMRRLLVELEKYGHAAYLNFGYQKRPTKWATQKLFLANGFTDEGDMLLWKS